MTKFNIGDYVRKTKGSQWQGTVVGTYSTALTPEGYAVESDTEKGSVQIYPASALEFAVKQTAAATTASLQPAGYLNRQPLFLQSDVEKLLVMQRAVIDSVQDAYTAVCSYVQEGNVKGVKAGESCHAALIADHKRLTASRVQEQVKHDIVPNVTIRCETIEDKVTGPLYLRVVRVEANDDGSFTAVTDYWPPNWN